jgi:ketosteroid isomerase-like protein
MKPVLPAAAAFVLAACAATISPTMDLPASLAAAETAFAAHSVREDMRAAFLAAFAPDGVFVRDGWKVSNDFLRNQPAPPIVLDWKPVHVEVAAAGDLGLSTGPSRISSKTNPDAAPRYGQFVSVWRRVGEGPWKVEVDLGISHPAATLWDAPLVARQVAAGPPASGTLAAAELEFATLAREAGLRAAHARLATADLRFYRPGQPPVLGRQVALASPGMTDAKMEWIVERTETSSSGDLGYTRGRYTDVRSTHQPIGYYLRVWRREHARWRVALEVVNAAPPPRPIS